ncbi:MAG: DNA polymerase domain-containing protein [Candidatus Bathyarchaeota archaeon]|nr:DNA polymerase domain-containing protein [Candidatus Bathyarchaeota archaeon]
MPRRGWLLDPYIRGKDAHLWIKTVEGEALHLTERHRPHFVAEPGPGFDVDDLCYLLEEHKLVHSARPVERYPTLRKERLERVAEARVDSASCLDKVVEYARSLREVREVYDVGLSPIQWYLIEKGVAPTSLCEFEAEGGILKGIKALDDGGLIEPPPFKTLLIRLPDAGAIGSVDVYEADEKLYRSLRGDEEKVLGELKNLLREEDPDVVVVDDTQTLRWVASRASQHSIDLGFGREGELIHGRIVLGYHSWSDMGLAGLAERSLFTLAPMGVSSDWEAGKTIDSRQCLEAYRQRILVPEMKGGYVSSMNAWEMVKRDRGGMLFTPQVGLHENVGCIDFESMFPSIISRRNVSYETVTEDGVDLSRPGFMGCFTAPTLERRLRFKHMRKQFQEGSREWTWCEERQASLKLMLVVIYGYSGCYANRFANVQVFQEINRQARQALVKALNIALGKGYEVVYGNTDALYTKRADATEADYEELAAEIAEATGLPIKLDKHFRFLVLLGKVTDPLQGASNRYYGKLTDGSLFYRGIELRRHDTPVYLKRLQERVMATLFDAEDAEEVLRSGLPRALAIANRAFEEVRRGRVEARELVISKRLSRELSLYRSLQAHVVAALLGAEEEGNSRYVFVNSESSNPFLRVKPSFMVGEAGDRYDRKKYVVLTKRAVMSLLSPFVDEEGLTARRIRATNLEDFIRV